MKILNTILFVIENLQQDPFEKVEYVSEKFKLILGFEYRNSINTEKHIRQHRNAYPLKL